jgi:hypothetical protein
MTAIITLVLVLVATPIVDRTYPHWGHALARWVARIADRVDRTGGTFLGELQVLEEEEDAGLWAAVSFLRVAARSRSVRTSRSFRAAIRTWAHHSIHRQEIGSTTWAIAVFAAAFQGLLLFGTYIGLFVDLPRAPLLIKLALLGLAFKSAAWSLHRVTRKYGRSPADAIREENAGWFMLAHDVGFVCFMLVMPIVLASQEVPALTIAGSRFQTTGTVGFFLIVFAKASDSASNVVSRFEVSRKRRVTTR